MVVPGPDSLGAVSTVPFLDDVLAPDVDVLSFSAAARLLGTAVTRVEQLVRDRELLAFKRNRVPVVPAVFVEADERRVLKGLTGLITVLHDGGYDDSDILRWLFTPDDTLPGAPVDALAGNRGKEVTRRAQAMAL